jgi:hypothetical protein
MSTKRYVQIDTEESASRNYGIISIIYKIYANILTVFSSLINRRTQGTDFTGTASPVT